MAKRRTIDVLVTLSFPHDRNAAWARKEARHLINEGVGYFTNAGDDDGIKARSVKALPVGVKSALARQRMYGSRY